MKIEQLESLSEEEVYHMVKCDEISLADFLRWILIIEQQAIELQHL